MGTSTRARLGVRIDHIRTTVPDSQPAFCLECACSTGSIRVSDALPNGLFWVQATRLWLLFKLQAEEADARIGARALLSACFWGLTLLCAWICAA